MMLTCPGPKVPMWSPAMKLPCVLVMRWISYSEWAFQPQISLREVVGHRPERVLRMDGDDLLAEDRGVRPDGLLVPLGVVGVLARPVPGS